MLPYTHTLSLAQSLLKLNQLVCARARTREIALHLTARFTTYPNADALFASRDPRTAGALAHTQHRAALARSIMLIPLACAWPGCILNAIALSAVHARYMASDAEGLRIRTHDSVLV